MIGIDPYVVKHQLNMKPGRKPVPYKYVDSIQKGKRSYGTRLNNFWMLDSFEKYSTQSG